MRMRNRSKLLQVLRASLFVAFAFVAIASRAIMPTGWMVAPSGPDGSTPIQLCSGHWVSWDASTGDIGESVSRKGSNDHPTENTTSCPYAVSALGLSATPYAISQIILVTARPYQLPYTRAPPIDRRNLTVLPARGPPSSFTNA